MSDVACAGILTIDVFLRPVPRTMAPGEGVRLADARFHPGGNLGFQLRLELTRVDEIMRTGASNPVVGLGVTVAGTALKVTLAERRPGAVCVVDRGGKLVGLFTDSDLRRLFAGKTDEKKEGPMHEPWAPITTHFDWPSG